MINLILSIYYLITLLFADGLFFLDAAPGHAIPEMGREHMSSSGIGGCQPSYNSRPPTSGCHHPSILNYEIYDTAQPDINLVHNLEHGAVIIHYRLSLVSSADDELLIANLTDLITELKERDQKYCRLILAPYDVPFGVPSVPELANDAAGMKIALTAWTYLDLMTEFDEKRIVRFIDERINQGPESYINDCR